MYKLTDKEIILPDSQLMYIGFVYIMDNKIVRNPIMGTVEVLKQYFQVSEIRKCDLMGHFKAKVGDFVYKEYYSK